MVKNPPGNVGDSRDVVGTTQVVPGSGRFLGGGNGTLSSITWGQSHGQRSLVGYSPWGRKELDTTQVRAQKMQAARSSAPRGLPWRRKFLKLYRLDEAPG